MELTEIAKTRADERTWLTGFAPTVHALRGGLRVPSRHFILALAADVRDVPEPELVEVATALLQAGAVYVCTWGPGAQRFESAFDEAAVGLEPERPDAAVILTTSHEHEPLEEALWFAVHSTWPARAYEADTAALVAVAVGSHAWQAAITGYLVAGAPLQDEV